MAKVEVFDPPMCCSTGVCGPSVDPALAKLAADLRWVEKRGASVTRYNLAQEPGPFAAHAGVRTLLAEGGEDVLPVVVVDGEVRASGRYPAKAELAAWALPGDSADILDEVTTELVPIGAAAGPDAGPGVGSGAWRDTAERLLPLAELAQEASPCCGGTAAEGESSPAAVAGGSGGCCG